MGRNRRLQPARAIQERREDPGHHRPKGRTRSKRGKTPVRDQPNSTPQQQGREEDSNRMMERSQIPLDGPCGQPGLFPQGHYQA